MAWTVEILSTETFLNNAGIKTLRINVRLMNGTDVIDDWFAAPDMETLKQYISNKIAAMDNAMALAGEIAIGTLDLTPTVALQNRQAFFNALNRLFYFQRLVAAGVLTGAEKEVTDQLALSQSLYDPSY